MVVPMANEEEDFAPFVQALCAVLERVPGGRVFLVVDDASRDATLQLCRDLAAQDARFRAVYAPENRCLADAYQRGLREAAASGCAYVIEMDAGLSHDPEVLPRFLEALRSGQDAALGSRFVPGGAMIDSPLRRRALSRGGTWLANTLLGTRLRDMTSGYQGFRAELARAIGEFPLRSSAHFYQTEIRFLLRRRRCVEIPIRYRAPSPRVSGASVRNSLAVLMHYFLLRLQGRAPAL